VTRTDHEEDHRHGRRCPGSPPPGSRYADQRPYVVADRLGDLRGPTTGVVDLDPRLDWSGRARFDLNNPRRLASLYETVLREATTPYDLNQWLEETALIRLWPALVLPPQVRRQWQDRFPQLTLSGGIAA